MANSTLGTSLDAAAATGAGDTVRGTAANHFTFQVETTGSPTTVVIGAEGSLDGTSWTELNEHTVSGTPDMFHIANKPLEYIRANLKTLTGGTSPTVTVKILVKDN